MPHRDQNHRRTLRFEVLENRQLLAGDFELLKDINTTPNNWGSNPSSYTHPNLK